MLENSSPANFAPDLMNKKQKRKAQRFKENNERKKERADNSREMEIAEATVIDSEFKIL